MKTIIEAKDFKLTPTITQYVEEHAAKLSHYDSEINRVRFALDVERHHQKGDKFVAEAWVEVKGDVVQASDRAEEMHQAIDGVLGKLTTQLERRKEKRLDKRKGR